MVNIYIRLKWFQTNLKYLHSSNIQNKILTFGLNVKSISMVKIWSIFVDILENTNLKCSFNHEALNQVLRFFHFFLCFGTIWIL